MGSNSLFSSGVVEESEEQIYLWQETINHLMTELKTVEDQLGEARLLSRETRLLSRETLG
jgi:hypothetical protein